MKRVRWLEARKERKSERKDRGNDRKKEQQEGRVSPREIEMERAKGSRGRQEIQRKTRQKKAEEDRGRFGQKSERQCEKSANETTISESK